MFQCRVISLIYQASFIRKKLKKQTQNITIVTITNSLKKCLDKNGLTQLNGTPNLHFIKYFE